LFLPGLLFRTMSAYEIREAQREDLDALMAVEESCFATDRLSRRAMRQWLEKKHRIMLVASVDGAVAGYALIIHHQGTRLGRLYSIAVLESRRGLGLARALLSEGEKRAAQRGCIDLRLEVAHVNKRAIAIYQAAGYREFGLLQDYYEDHSDAVRMQKRILQPQASARLLPLVWLPQQMEFTCGPAALMMALQHLAPNYIPSLTEELRIWREANTVFMTSGPGAPGREGGSLDSRPPTAVS
jgi:ribosomal protein S18 acetylase RimI-like enzyme